MKCVMPDNKDALIAQQQLDLGHLIELSDLMLKAALEDQWDSVREQQIHRDKLLRDFFEKKIEIEDQLVVKGIQYMIDSDQKLNSLGQEEKSTQYIVFHGDFDYTSENRVQLDAMSKILSTRLLEVIREDKSSVYSIGAYPQTSHYPKSDYGVTVFFGCSPDNVENLTDAVFVICFT